MVEVCELKGYCLWDFGLCLMCGREDGLPWGPMIHEGYGAFIGKFMLRVPGV